MTTKDIWNTNSPNQKTIKSVTCVSAKPIQAVADVNQMGKGFFYAQRKRKENTARPRRKCVLSVFTIQSGSA